MFLELVYLILILNILEQLYDTYLILISVLNIIVYFYQMNIVFHLFLLSVFKNTIYLLYMQKKSCHKVLKTITQIVLCIHPSR